MYWAFGHIQTQNRYAKLCEQCFEFSDGKAPAVFHRLFLSQIPMEVK